METNGGVLSVAPGGTLPGIARLERSQSLRSEVGYAVNYVTSCWATNQLHPWTAVPVKVDGHDTEALLDSGSMVTLVTSLLNWETERGSEMSISCVHGDTKNGIQLYGPTS